MPGVAKQDGMSRSNTNVSFFDVTLLYDPEVFSAFSKHNLDKTRSKCLRQNPRCIVVLAITVREKGNESILHCQL